MSDLAENMTKLLSILLVINKTQRANIERK